MSTMPNHRGSDPTDTVIVGGVGQWLRPYGVGVIAAVWLLALIAIADAQGGNDAPFSKQTAWGDPDVQGTWSYATTTPLETPPDGAPRPPADAEDPDHPWDEWWDRGPLISAPALIVEPSDGRIPWRSPHDGRAAPAGADETFNAADTRPLPERCLHYRPLPRLPSGYNNHQQIFQTPDYVAIVIEMIHLVRLIPLDGRPHISPRVRLWNGDARGWWEGDTLVVETLNFSAKSDFQGAREGLHLIERFTRVEEERLDYRFTVSDPTVWQRPWSAALPFTPANGPIFEYACHEGNYSIVTTLRAHRLRDSPSLHDVAR